MSATAEGASRRIAESRGGERNAGRATRALGSIGLTVASVLATAGSASAEFTEVGLVSMGELLQGTQTWRVVAYFDQPDDYLLSVHGWQEIESLRFTTDDPEGLRNGAGALDGFLQEDVPSLFAEAWDSWVTIGVTQNATDVQFSPGFLGNNGVDSVIRGDFFSQADNGGYFDSNPTSQKAGGAIVIAQFTIGAGYNLQYQGTLAYNPGNSPGLMQIGFSVATTTGLGACCLGPEDCIITTSVNCGSVQGIYLGESTTCATQTASEEIEEDGGGVFTHVIAVDLECPDPVQASDCVPDVLFDAWTSPANQKACQTFGVDGSPAIPADFFGPGSDVWSAGVCLRGKPLGPIILDGVDLEFGDADTLIRRSHDPFDACDLPSDEVRYADLEIAALSLESIDPIVVTYGGANPPRFDVTVDLSEIYTDEDPTNDPPVGTLEATMDHCNGGTYRSMIFVRPRFTFTNVFDKTDVYVLDTGLEGLPPILLDGTRVAAPWVLELDASIAVNNPTCSTFRPGVAQLAPIDACDCNSNGLRDKCDIDEGRSSDCNGNGLPDECEESVCPADVDGSCHVGWGDLLALLADWGPAEECPPYLDTDFDQDCAVGVADLETMLSSWGTCGSR